MNAKRTYGQACALAKALDLVGERWTLLMVRELLIQPRRYRELLENLPGMGTNLLASRLKEMEQAGMVQRQTDEHDRRSHTYSLTEWGLELAPVVQSLVRWGVGLLGAPVEGELSKLEWDFLALRLLFRGEKATGLDGRYQLRSGETLVSLRVHNGELEVEPSEADEGQPTVIEGPDDIIRDIILGRRRIGDPGIAKQIRIIGSTDKAERFLKCFQP